MKTLKWLYERFFGFEGAALVSTKLAFFYSVGGNETEGYTFAWYTTDHSKGEVCGPFAQCDAADLACNRWLNLPAMRGTMPVRVS